MKKTLLTIAVASLVAATTYGQGTVTFANTSTSLVRRSTSITDSTVISMQVGGGFVELLWAPSGTTDINAFQSVAITDFHTAPGRFSGGTVTAPIPQAGGGASFIIRGWTGTAANWAAVNPATDAYGVSAIFTLAATGNPTTVPAGTPVALTSGASPFTGVTLTYAPEPTSMALAGLGAASLLIFRRRK